MGALHRDVRWFTSRLSLSVALLGGIVAAGGCDADRSPESPEAARLSASVSPALAAPSQLSSTLSSRDAVSLGWMDNSKNEDGFEIDRSITGATGSYAPLATTAASVTTYADPGLRPETQYCYEVRAFRTTGNKTTYSSFSSPTCSTTPPNAASNTTASPVSSTQVSIGWTDNSASEDGFRVERSTDGGATWAVVGSTTANQTRTTDVGRTPERPQVCYRVTAYNANGSSLPSPTACTTTPAAPTNLTATVTGTSVVLAWTDNSSIEDGYEVRRTGAGQALTAIATLPANATGYTDTQASGDISYYYFVAARKDGGYSDLSIPAQALVAATPPAAPSSVQAMPASSSLASITWQDNAMNESGFRIERSSDGGASWTSAGTVGPDLSSFEDDGQPAEQQLCYRVIAFNSKGDSAPSSVDCTALPLPPVDVLATAVDDQNIDLTWSAGASVQNGITVRDGYLVFRYDFVCDGWGWTCDYEYEPIATATADATSFRDSGLSGGTSYSYFLVATNDGGMSDPSVGASDVTAPTPGMASALAARALPSASQLRAAATRAVKRLLSAPRDTRGRRPARLQKAAAPTSGKARRPR